MKNKIILQNSPGAAEKAVSVLLHPGAVVLLPTETVYGLVCRAADKDAVENIYRLKSRDRNKRLAWFVHDWRILDSYGVKLNSTARRLAEKYCPGAITIISETSGGLTQGFRIPDHKLVLDILRKINEPLCSTSANLSGEPNALSPEAALASLDGEVDLAVDGGCIPPDSLASTVVNCAVEPPQILRQGGLEIEL